MKQLLAPVPGMSLTKEPGNSPWEQPPLYAKPEEALAFYLQKLSDEEILDDMLFTLEQGYPVSAFVESMTSYGAMEGYHTIDVKMLLAPILHEHIMTLADALGIEVVEEAGPSKEEKVKAKDKQRIMIMMEKALSTTEPVKQEFVEEAEQALDEESPSTESLIPRRL